MPPGAIHLEFNHTVLVHPRECLANLRSDPVGECHWCLRDRPFPVLTHDVSKPHLLPKPLPVAFAILVVHFSVRVRRALQDNVTECDPQLRRCLRVHHLSVLDLAPGTRGNRE